MGDGFYYDDPSFWLIVTGILGFLLFGYFIDLFHEYKKFDDKSRLHRSVVMLILCAAVIAGGAFMIKRTTSNSKILEQALESNDTIRSLLEECTKRNAPGAADETEKPDAALKNPYLIVGYENENNKLVLIDSPAGQLTSKAFEEAGTIVLAYPYVIGQHLYQQCVNGSKSGSNTETRWAVRIYFYDVVNRDLVFFKELTGDEFPEKAKSYDGQVSLSDIKDAVRTAGSR